MGKEDTDLRVSSLQEQQLGEDDDGDDEPTPQDIEYVAQIKRVSLFFLFFIKLISSFTCFASIFLLHFRARLQVLELLRKNRDMLFGEVP